MKKESNIISLAFITMILFLLSTLLYSNDMINYFIVSITLTFISFIYLLYIVFSKKDEISMYKKKLKRILNTYDSIIIHSKNNIDFLSNEIIFVKNIKDLLVVQTELNKMIVYIDQDKSSIFLIHDNKQLYVYVLKVNSNIYSEYELNLKSKLRNNIFLVNNS